MDCRQDIRQPLATGLSREPLHDRLIYLDQCLGRRLTLLSKLGVTFDPDGHRNDLCLQRIRQLVLGACQVFFERMPKTSIVIEGPEELRLLFGLGLVGRQLAGDLVKSLKFGMTLIVCRRWPQVLGNHRRRLRTIVHILAFPSQRAEATCTSSLRSRTAARARHPGCDGISPAHLSW